MTTYQVYKDGQMITSPETGTNGLLEWTTNDVSPGVSYEFNVAAVNLRGTGQ